jgi:hypothetical protein
MSNYYSKEKIKMEKVFGNSVIKSCLASINIFHHSFKSLQEEMNQIDANGGGRGD